MVFVKKMIFFFQQIWSPLSFISRSSSFSVIHVNEDIRIKSKEKVALLLLSFSFISKSPEGYAINRRNARMLEMQNFTPAYMKGWT